MNVDLSFQKCADKTEQPKRVLLKPTKHVLFRIIKSNIFNKNTRTVVPEFAQKL